MRSLPDDVLPLPDVLETPENASGGVLVVTLPGYGPTEPPVRRGNFFDNSIDRGPVLKAFIGWFSLWGIEPNCVRGREGAFERQFFTLEWPASKSVFKHAHGPQMVPRIAGCINELAAVLKARRPRLVIFLSRYLWLAVNAPEAREVLADIIGSPLEKGRRITTGRLNAVHQSWQGVTMIALPQPSKNTTAQYVATLAPGVRQALRETRAAIPENASDPLALRARECLIIDREASVASIAARLHVEKSRAAALFDALEGEAWTSDGARVLARIPRPQKK